jgi:hypothetical protein
MSLPVIFLYSSSKHTRNAPWPNLIDKQIQFNADNHSKILTISEKIPRHPGFSHPLEIHIACLKYGMRIILNF